MSIVGLSFFLWQMQKKDYKAHLAAYKFDLNTLPICGARTRSGGLWKHNGNVRNGRCERYGINK